MKELINLSFSVVKCWI